MTSQTLDPSWSLSQLERVQLFQGGAILPWRRLAGPGLGHPNSAETTFQNHFSHQSAQCSKLYIAGPEFSTGSSMLEPLSACCESLEAIHDLVGSASRCKVKGSYSLIFADFGWRFSHYTSDLFSMPTFTTGPLLNSSYESDHMHRHVLQFTACTDHYSFVRTVSSPTFGWCFWPFRQC